MRDQQAARTHAQALPLTVVGCFCERVGACVHACIHRASRNAGRTFGSSLSNQAAYLNVGSQVRRMQTYVRVHAAGRAFVCAVGVLSVSNNNRCCRHSG